MHAASRQNTRFVCSLFIFLIIPPPPTARHGRVRVSSELHPCPDLAWLPPPSPGPLNRPAVIPTVWPVFLLCTPFYARRTWRRRGGKAGFTIEIELSAARSRNTRVSFSVSQTKTFIPSFVSKAKTYAAVKPPSSRTAPK